MKKNRALHSSFERRGPLLPLQLFIQRLLRHGLISLIIFLALNYRSLWLPLFRKNAVVGRLAQCKHDLEMEWGR